MHGTAMRFPESVLLRPSRVLAIVVGLMHGAAVALLLPLALPVWLKGSLAAAVLVSLAGALRGALQRRSQSITRLTLSDEGILTFEQKDGRRMSAAVALDSTVFGLLAVVRLQVQGERRMRTLIVLPDALEADQFRHLRVWLRWRTSVSRDLA
jgi:toxin CptA